MSDPAPRFLPSEPSGAGALGPDGACEAAGPMGPSRGGVASVLDHLPVGVYRTDARGRILYANPALAEVLGASSVEALYTVDVRSDLGYPRDAFESELRRAEAVRNLVVTWTRRDGRTVHTRENARVVSDDAGRFLYYEGTMEDVTAEVEAQHEDRARDRGHAAIVRFAAAADEATTARSLHQAGAEAVLDATGAAWAFVVVASPDGNVCDACAGALDIAALDALNQDEAFQTLAIPRRAVLAPDLSASAPAAIAPSVLRRLSAAGIGAFACVPIFRADEVYGALVWGREAPASFPGGEVRAAEALAWHLAGHLARARAVQALWDSEASLQAIAAHTPHVLYRFRYTPEGGAFDYLSPAIESLTGYSAAEIRSRGGLSALLHQRVVFQGHGLGEGPVEGADRYHAEYRVETARGDCWVENTAHTWRDAAGTALGLVGVLQDVTVRKLRASCLADAAQQALGRQRTLVDLARLPAADALGRPAAEAAAAALGAAAVSFWLVGASGGACRALAAPTGPPLATDAARAVFREVAGDRALAIDDVASDPRVEALGLRPFAEGHGLDALLLAPVRRHGEGVGLVVVHPADGAHGWDPDAAAFAAAVADALALALERQERATAQAALAASEHRYRALAEMTSDYAFAVHVGPDGGSEIAWATDAFERICGHRPESVAGHEGFLQILHPDSRPAVAAALAACHEPGLVEFEVQILTAGGEARWVHHRARSGAPGPEGSTVVYHTGQDITARKRYESGLVEAREQAERSREEAEVMSRLQTSFLENMSHEIRTPLTGILGYADLLADELDGPQREFAALIARNGFRLLDTLNAVLDLSRLEAGQLQAAVESTDVAAAIREATLRLSDQATEKGLGFDLDVRLGRSSRAALDPSAFRQVVAHLVSNAVKFTAVGGVVVTAEAEGPDLVVRVADTGAGISAEFLPHLFDAFRQEDSGLARAHEGVGLGLTVTRRLVELLGGRIDVQSARPGGTVCTVVFAGVLETPADAEPADCSFSARWPAGDGLPSLPALAATPPAAEAVAVAPPPAFTYIAVPPDRPPLARPPSETHPSALATPTAMFDFKFGRSAAPPPPAPTPAPVDPAGPPARPAFGAPRPDAAPTAPAAPAPPPPPPAEPVMIVRAAPEDVPAPPAEDATVVAEPADDRPAVLVVEDNNDTRMLLERILRSTYDVTAVADARSALTAMNHKRFTGLVLDINLGGKETGADVLRIARSLPGYDGVFAIALTAYALPGDRERLLAAGFNEYISKPFTRQSLMETLEAGVLA